MRLINSTLFLGTGRLLVNVENDGIVREVEVRAFDKHNRVPRGWARAAFGEVDFVITEEKKKAEGRPTL